MPARTARSARASRSLWEPQSQMPRTNPSARSLGNPTERPTSSHGNHIIQREEERRPLLRGPLLSAPLTGGGAECNQCEALRIMVATARACKQQAHTLRVMAGRRLFS
jgi:hypothetical protein